MGVIQKQHVEMDIQVEGATKALDQRDRAGLCRLAGEACFVDQMRRQYAIDNAQHLACLIAGRLANRNHNGNRKLSSN